jgi:hypothetical protein
MGLTQNKNLNKGNQMPRTEELQGIEGEGVAPKRIKRLDNAVEKWRSIVADRQALTEKEVEARDKCVEIMHQEGLKTYRYWDSDDDQKDLVLIGAEKLKLQKIKDVAEGSETDADAD